MRASQGAQARYDLQEAGVRGCCRLPRDTCGRAKEIGTNSIQTLPIDDVLKNHRTKEHRTESPISLIAPVVVRQDDPGGPRYQEALGYTFLIEGAGFPGLVRMDDGKLVLTMPTRDGNRILFSEDEGMSWSRPQPIPIGRCSPVNLGGTKLMLRGNACDEHLVFSDDAGRTWSDPEPIPHLPDGRECYTDVALNGLVEGETVTFIYHTVDWEQDWAYSFIRRYNVASHTWGDPEFFPEAWNSNEGAITRAKNGNLVAAFRFALPGIPMPSDHWCGQFTTVSKDDGKTWSEPSIHLAYGHVHQSLLPFPDGRILMTYAARIGELDGRTYHGIEAVMSHDHGATWDWERRYILFRWSSGYMHGPQSALLSDGRVLTSFMYHTDFPWSNGDPDRGPISFTPHASVVIWLP